MGKHTEIELKARVPRWRDCRRRLTELAGGGSSLVKDDGYWFPAAAPGASGLRVRREHTGGEGQTAEHTLVTYKTKERREGIEINDEHEFEVSDGAVFEELLERLGLEKRIAKHKTGWVWRYGGINAELVKVSGGAKVGGAEAGGAKVGGAEAGGTKVGGAGFDGGTGGPEPPDSAGTKDLGWFLELEILSGPGGSDEAVAAARGRLLELLAQAGIGEADLESRYYSELLAGGVSRDGVFKSP